MTDGSENSIAGAEEKAGNKKINTDRIIRVLIEALVLMAVCALIIAADQITKEIVYKKISYGTSKVLIPGLLELSHVHNTGAAWGIFDTHTGLLSVITVTACLLLGFVYFQSRNKLFKAALLLVIGGAIGNVIDRIFRGYVIDFIKVWIFRYEFPNFNIADSCITIGCVILIVAVLISGRKEGDTLLRGDSVLGKLFKAGRKQDIGGADNAGEKADNEAGGADVSVKSAAAGAVDAEADNTSGDSGADDE